MAILFEVPDGLLMEAAECAASFDALCRRLEIIPREMSVTYANKKPDRYRFIGLKLANGKFAGIVKADDSNCFSINLQMDMERDGFYLSEVEEVRQFVHLEKDDIRLINMGQNWF